jgi:hypothetical protein
VHCSAEGFNEVLTTPGQAALSTNSFFDPSISNCPVDPDINIDRVAFRGPWQHERMRLQTEKFCKEIGVQLFRLYLSAKGWPWPEPKIEACSCGMYGLGLNLSFGHSIPKASLPLLWASGPVRYDRSTVDWVPLFENGAF